ncbi:2-oxoadipate dioxygenase/decarboxylase family protein [Labilibaculum euxinus]
MQQEIFHRLWKEYTKQNPSAQAIHDLFTKEGEQVINDHVAFRTFDDPRMNIQVLAKKFLKAGYEYKGEYVFEDKHLNAVHLEHPSEENAPRVFISELILSKFSEEFQKTIKRRLNSVGNAYYADPDLIHKGSVWGKPSYADYQSLRNESEYAAWLYVHGFRVNHFTVSINALQKYNSIEKVNQFIKDNGFEMNTSGGEIKGTPEKLLQQSSTLSEIIKVEFEEGVYEIPACFYEFAIRYPDENGQLFSSFIAANANKIFDSSNFREK